MCKRTVIVWWEIPRDNAYILGGGAAHSMVSATAGYDLLCFLRTWGALVETWQPWYCYSLNIKTEVMILPLSQGPVPTEHWESRAGGFGG
jgi:hypothetical protein